MKRHGPREERWCSAICTEYAILSRLDCCLTTLQPLTCVHVSRVMKRGTPILESCARSRETFQNASFIFNSFRHDSTFRYRAQIGENFFYISFSKSCENGFPGLAEMCEIETRIVFVFEKYERREEEFGTDTKRVSFFFLLHQLISRQFNGII